MKSLKVFVVSMGVLIVVGLFFLGYGVYRNLMPAGKSASGAMSGQSLPAASSADEGAGYFAVDLPVPAGGRLEQMTVAGERIVLRFSSPEGDRLTLVDPKTGHVAGTVTLVPTKP